MESTFRKFPNLKRFTDAVVEAHKMGSPMNPEGCRGNMLMQIYSDVDKEYTGNTGIYGTHIQCSSLKAYCASVNKILDEGGEVYSSKAYTLHGIFKCPILQVRGRVNESNKSESKTSEAVAETIPETTSTEAVEDVSGAGTHSLELPVQEVNTPDEGSSGVSGEPNEEVQVGTEAAELSIPAAEQSDAVGETDVQETTGDVQELAIDFSEIEKMTKAKIIDYAATLNILLDRNKNKTVAIETFRQALKDRGML